MKVDCSIELAIDIETYSSVDIKNGAYAYSEAPDFEILLIAYKFSDEDEVRIVPCNAYMLQKKESLRFMQALKDPSIIKTAYNANFERTCIAKEFDIQLPPEEWRCTMILAAQMGLPRSLKDVGAVLGLAEDKQKLKTGTALISYFCKPCKPTRANGMRTRNRPDDDTDKWKLFKEYCMQDVVTEQAVLEALKAFKPNAQEQRLWSLDQKINDNGVLLDIPMARSIVDFDNKRTAELKARAQAITGLDNPNSLSQLKPWLESHHLDIDTLRKDDVSDLIGASYISDDVREVLRIRQAISKTSVKKYQTMLDIAGHDNRARGIMQFYGSHTGRWAGRSLQPQNLKRNSLPDAELDAARALVKAEEFEGLELLYGEPSEIFSQLVRTAFIPSLGHRFVVSDFAAIEARVLAWVAGEEWRLQVFRDGGDIYCESASRIYHVPVEKHGENAHLRQRGKVAELALGYGGAVGAMKQMDSSGAVPEDEMKQIVKDWRAGSPKIVEFWYGVEKSAIKALRKGTATFGMFEFKRQQVGKAKVLEIELPSGRCIRYWDPKVLDSEMGDRLTYMHQNQTTRRWERHETYGGKLTENIVQAIARDCLAEKMMDIDDAGFDIVFHVHDELIVDALKNDAPAAKFIDDIMGQPIDWAPGLPLKGGTYECDFYRKD